MCTDCGRRSGPLRHCTCLCMIARSGLCSLTARLHPGVLMPGTLQQWRGAVMRYQTVRQIIRPDAIDQALDTARNAGRGPSLPAITGTHPQPGHFSWEGLRRMVSGQGAAGNAISEPSVPLVCGCWRGTHRTRPKLAGASLFTHRSHQRAWASSAGTPAHVSRPSTAPMVHHNHHCPLHCKQPQAVPLGAGPNNISNSNYYILGGACMHAPAKHTCPLACEQRACGQRGRTRAGACHNTGHYYRTHRGLAPPHGAHPAPSTGGNVTSAAHA